MYHVQNSIRNVPMNLCQTSVLPYHVIPHSNLIYHQQAAISYALNPASMADFKLSQFKMIKPDSQTKVRKQQIKKTKKDKLDKKSKEKENARKKFTPEEDEKLKNLVENSTFKKWDVIAKEMPGRTGRQCRDRYKNYLIPGFFNGQWSVEEDNLLRQKYFEYGSHWSKITPFFRNRSANSLKNRWNYFVSKHLEYEFEKPSKILNVYDNNNNFISTNNDVDNEKNDNEFLYESIINSSSFMNPFFDYPFDVCEFASTNENDEINCKDDFY